MIFKEGEEKEEEEEKEKKNEREWTRTWGYQAW